MTKYLKQAGVTAALAAALLGSGVAFAQSTTTNSTTGYTGSTNTTSTTGVTTGTTGTTGTAATTGTGTTGTTGTTPGTPNTGVGGDAMLNWLMLGVAGAAAVAGLEYLSRKVAAAR